jgi:hypothetical protein
LDSFSIHLHFRFSDQVIKLTLPEHHYFEGDYNAIGAAGSSPVVAGLPAAAIEGSDVAANTIDLYNGNIKAMQTTLTHPVTQELMPMPAPQ